MFSTRHLRIHALALCTLALCAAAANAENSGFLDDYSRLAPTPVHDEIMFYAKPEYESIVADVTTVVIAQPEIFISPDSKYRGIKPDDMKRIADVLQAAMYGSFEDGYRIAVNPGPESIIIRTAISNLKMKKRPKRLFQYLPPAFVATTLKRTLLDDIAKNILLTEAVLEIESVDGDTGEVLGQLVVPIGAAMEKNEFPKKLQSWDEMAARMALASTRLRCRLDNVKLDESERLDCFTAVTMNDVILID